VTLHFEDKTTAISWQFRQIMSDSSLV
jgi:hypothetical protein